MIKQSLILLFCALIAFESQSQNLLANGDFENYSTLPNSSMDWSYCVGWNNVNLNSGSWPYATPDYFHTSGSGGGNIPNTAFGNVTAQSGNAVIGLYSKHSSQSNSRDYMSCQLSSPLVVGTAYTISFWMSNGYGNYKYGSSCSHMGVQLSMAPLSQTNHENIGGTPQFEVTSDPWLTGWNMYSTVYVATQPYQYFTIGVFRNDASISSTVHASGANFPTAAYYFIDNVIVQPASLLPIELLSFSAVKQRSSVDLLWETNTEIDNDYFTIERSADLNTWTVIGVVDGAGNSDEINSYSILDEEPLEGINYYRLSQTNFDGTTSHSDIRSVDFIPVGELKIYPVPAEEIVVVQGNDVDFSDFQVFDAFGKVVNDHIGVVEQTNEKLVLNVSQLASGHYFIGSSTSVTRFVKK